MGEPFRFDWKGSLAPERRGDVFDINICSEFVLNASLDRHGMLRPDSAGDYFARRS